MIIGFSTVDRRSGSSVLTDKELAKRDLLNRFYTRKGERLGEPEYGSILPELVFDPAIDVIRDAADEDVRSAIRDDPRWELIDHTVEERDHAITINVRARYLDDISEEEIIAVYRTES